MQIINSAMVLLKIVLLKNLTCWTGAKGLDDWKITMQMSELAKHLCDFITKHLRQVLEAVQNGYSCLIVHRDKDENLLTENLMV